MPDTSPPLLALAGGAGSGKSTLAVALAAARPATAVVHLDACFHHDTSRAPCVPAIGGKGVRVDFSDPASIDRARVEETIGAALVTGRLVVVEGTFALTLPYVRDRARWTAYVDVPADIRLARKTLRKLRAGEDPGAGLLGYLAHGRAAHERHVEPMARCARLLLDGTAPVPRLVGELGRFLGSHEERTAWR
ncbi:uridine kinase [Streptomyces niveus]|uniref:uridine kinase family protein n=1 Tax=Streptomyces niveus TaxID=193462 RepID=UPI0036B99693